MVTFGAISYLNLKQFSYPSLMFAIYPCGASHEDPLIYYNWEEVTDNDKHFSIKAVFTLGKNHTKIGILNAKYFFLFFKTH